MMDRGNLIFYVIIFAVFWVSLNGSNNVPAEFDHLDKIYINSFKFNLRDIKLLEHVIETVSAKGFQLTNHIVSTIYLFRKDDVQPYSIKPYNVRQLELLQNTLTPMVVSIEQDFERRIFTSAYKEKQRRISQSTKTQSKHRHINERNEAKNQEYQSPDTLIRIAVADARFQTDHPNLRKAIDFSLCYDFIDNDANPSIDKDNDIFERRPELYHILSHGTKCMGLIGAENFNGCDQGVAPNVKLVGLRMITDWSTLSDERESLALSFKPNDIDVYSCSYSIQDNEGFYGPLLATNMALKDGVENGRKCRGRIFVYPSGNGDDDNCNADGYANSVYTITVANVKKDGSLPINKEVCACALAATIGEGFTTTDLHGECSDLFYGASAATAVAAGYIGETLTINPLLSKRDIEHIIVKTSKKNTNISWRANGVGLLFNDQIGFGIMDLDEMKEIAAQWNYSATYHKCIIPGHSTPMSKKVSGKTLNLNILIEDDSCSNKSTQVRYIEHVQVDLNLKCSNIEAIEINLISPMNTSSPILTKMKLNEKDKSKYRDFNWTFMSVQFWGENPVGNWTVTFNKDNDTEGEFDLHQIIFHGTQETANSETKPQQCDRGNNADFDRESDFSTFDVLFYFSTLIISIIYIIVIRRLYTHHLG